MAGPRRAPRPAIPLPLDGAEARACAIMPSRPAPARPPALLLFFAACLACGSIAPAGAGGESERPRLVPSTGAQYLLVALKEDAVEEARFVWRFTKSGAPVCVDRSSLLPHGDPATHRAYAQWCLGTMLGSASDPDMLAAPNLVGFEIARDGEIEAVAVAETAREIWREKRIAEIEEFLRTGAGAPPRSVEPDGFFRDLFLHLQEWLRDRLAAEEPARAAGWFEIYELAKEDDAEQPGAIIVIACATLEEQEERRRLGAAELAARFAAGTWKAPAVWNLPDFGGEALDAGQRRLEARLLGGPMEALPEFLKPSARVYSAYGGQQTMPWDEYELWAEKGVLEALALIESGAVAIPAGVNPRAAAEWRFHWNQLSRWRPDPPAPPTPTPTPTPTPDPFGASPFSSSYFSATPISPPYSSATPAAASSAPSTSSASSVPVVNPFAGPAGGSTSPFGGSTTPTNPFGGGSSSGAISPFGTAPGGFGGPPGGVGTPTPVATPPSAPSAPPASREEIVDAFAAGMARRWMARGDDASARYIAKEWLRGKGSSEMASVLDELFVAPSRREESAAE
jgi:hypothetical protein